MTETQEQWRTGAMYTFGEAARLSGVSVPTVRRWLQGYDTGNSATPPVFGDVYDRPLVSFLQLIEIAMASRFRTKHVSLKNVTKAYENAREQYKVDYPFARLQMEAWAGHIFDMMQADDHDSLSSLDAPGLKTLPGLVQEALASIDYEGNLASRWYPVGRDIPIVVDPRFAAGLPAIEHRGVPIAHIKMRFQGGQSIGYISRDLELQRNQVEQAIRYADQVAA